MGEESTIVNDDLVFEVELLKQVDVNIDYILMLVQKYHDSNCSDMTVVTDIERGIMSSLELRDKRDLIERFIEELDSSEGVTTEWRAYIARERESELAAIIEDERLKPAETMELVAAAFEGGDIPEAGTAIAGIMTQKPSRFAPQNAYTEMKSRVVARLKAFYERFRNLGAD